MKALDLATLLGKAGAAVSPNDSWQQRLGESAANMASAEQDRRYLADLLSGVPDPSGKHGLDPNVVLQGLQLRHQIEQSRPEPVQMTEVPLPDGQVVNVPVDEAAEYKRKVWAEQRDTVPSSIRTWREFQNMGEEEQKGFLEFSKNQRGKSFEETMAEYLIKRREAAKQDKRMEAQLNLGTPEHVNEIEKSITDTGDFSEKFSKAAERAKSVGGYTLTREQFREAQAIANAEMQIEDRTNLTNVRYKRGPEGEGFYGINENGEEVLHQKYQRRNPIKSR